MPLYPPATGGSAAVGPAHAVQYTDGAGNFQGASAILVDDPTLGGVLLGLATNGSDPYLKGAPGITGNVTGKGINLTGGDGFDNGAGGTADAGSASFQGGTSFGSGNAGSANLAGGTASGASGFGGGVNLMGGNGDTGGGVFLGLGTGSTEPKNGDFQIQGMRLYDPNDQITVWNDQGVLTLSGYPGAFSMDASVRQAGVAPNTGTTPPVAFNMSGTSSSSTTVGSTSTSATTRQIRTNWASAASAGSSVGWFTITRNIYISSVAGVGGCWFSAIGAIGTNTTGHQAFMGLSSTGALLTGDPSAMTNFIGVGYDAADLSTGNWWIMFNDGSGTATRVDTGIARAVDGGIKLNLDNLIGTLTWNYTVTPINGGSPFTGQATTNTPVTATELGFVICCRTGALTSANNIRLLNQYQKWWIN